MEPISRPLEADDSDRSTATPPLEWDECRYGPKSGRLGESDESGSNNGDNAPDSSKGDERIPQRTTIAHTPTRHIGRTTQ